MVKPFGKGRESAVQNGGAVKMPRGLPFVQISWLLIGSDSNFTGTSNSPKYQHPLSPTQVLDEFPNTQSPALPIMTDPYSVGNWNYGRFLPPQIGRAGRAPPISTTLMVSLLCLSSKE